MEMEKKTIHPAFLCVVTSDFWRKTGDMLIKVLKNRNKEKCIF